VGSQIFNTRVMTIEGLKTGIVRRRKTGGSEEIRRKRMHEPSRKKKLLVLEYRVAGHDTTVRENDIREPRSAG